MTSIPSMTAAPATSSTASNDINKDKSKSKNEKEDENENTTIEPDQDMVALVPDTGETSEGGKLKMIVQLLKRCLGVKDLAAMRLSLPASLLEPVPNLEYWQYLDRPDLFVSINDSEDPLERMLAVVRFTFTKDLKFVHGKIVKPYNSVLGEHFRAHWDVLPLEYPPDYPSSPPTPRQHTTSPQPSANASSVFGKGPKDESTVSFLSSKSFTSTKRASSIFDFATARITPLPKTPDTASSPETRSPKVNGIITNGTTSSSGGTVESNLAAGVSNLSLGDGGSGGSYESGDEYDADSRLRVVFLTEQVSHHPPISAYYATCPARGVSLMGIDQISARVSGTSVRISPGSQNKGIFVHLSSGAGKGEQYHITHPSAMVNGILRGNFYATISDSTIITCSGIDGDQKGRERLRAVLEYKDESWLGQAKFAVEGVIHTYREGDEDYKEWTKVKHVPKASAVAYFEGSWRGRIRWRRVNTSTSAASSTDGSGSSSSDKDRDAVESTLIDLSALLVVPKRVRPLDKQHAYESRKLWENVTKNLVAKEFGEANKHKHVIEQRQRDRAAERKRKGEEHTPAYFEKNIDSGIPVLTPEGQKVLEEELKSTDGES